MQILERLPNESSSSYAYRIILRNIASLSLLPGSTVDETSLAESIGLSRSPIHEALIKLERSRTIKIEQHNVHITLIDEKLVDESRFLRFTLEKAMIEQICKNKLDVSALVENVNAQKNVLKESKINELFELDNEFHRLLFQICGMDNIYDISQILAPHFDRVRILCINYSRCIDISDEHSNICNALRYYNIDAAIGTLTQHLLRYKKELISLKKQYPNYFKQKNSH